MYIIIINRAIWASPDGKKIAYGLSIFDNIDKKLASSMIIKVRDVNSCEDSEIDTIICDDIDVFTMNWYQNHSGFFYVTKSKDSNNVEILYHALGTSKSNDILAYKPISNNNAINSDDNIEEELLTFDITVTSDNHYLVIEVFKREDAKFIQMIESSTKFGDICSIAGNAVRIIDLTNFNNTLKPGLCAHLVTSFDSRFQFISNIIEDFWFRTNYCAKNYRVVRLNLPSILTTVLTDDNRYIPIIIPQAYISKNIREWIAEDRNGILQSASIAALTVLVLKYFKNCSNEILIYDLSQSLDRMPNSPAAALPQPTFGTITMYTPSCSFFSYNIFYKFSGFSHPCSIFRAQIIRNSGSGSIEISFDELYNVSVPGIDPYYFETRQESLVSYDGTNIPIFMFGSRNLFKSGEVIQIMIQ